MDTKSSYIFLPSFSLQPNKVVSYNSIFIQNKKNNTIKSIHDFKRVRKNKVDNREQLPILKRESHKLVISDNAYRTLKAKINWLYYLSKSKKVKTYKGKDIFNFKMAFITLTLPSKQLTSTKQVTADLLNPFLTEIKQRTKMDNYVWRLEFQKNGNVHYHLVTDTYLDYYLLKKIWNRLLNSKGYIEPYRAKMNNITLTDYVKKYYKNTKLSHSDIVKIYARNKRENWSQPNSVDVKSVISNKTISNYIAKYFGKDSNDNPIKNELDNDENSSNLRLWFCSRSLSKLKAVRDFCEAVEYDIFAIVSFSKRLKKVYYKYATSIYFDINSMRNNARKWIEKILKDYANINSYKPAKANNLTLNI